VFVASAEPLDAGFLGVFVRPESVGAVATDAADEFVFERRLVVLVDGVVRVVS